MHVVQIITRGSVETVLPEDWGEQFSGEVIQNSCIFHLIEEILQFFSMMGRARVTASELFQC